MRRRSQLGVCRAEDAGDGARADGDLLASASPRPVICPALHRLHRIELGKYLLWYMLPATWDMLLLAVLAVFVQALSPHKTVGWGLMVLFTASGSMLQHRPSITTC